MVRWQYTKGLHDLGNHVYADLQPDSGRGWSNAGLIAHDTGALLVDTLFDLSHTREMLATMRARAPGAQRSETLMNPHATFAIPPGSHLRPLLTPLHALLKRKCGAVFST